MTLVWGIPKSGKNTFVVGNKKAGIAHWPLPIHILNFDWGTDEIIPMTDEKVREGIIIHDIRADKPLTDAGVARESLKEFYDGLLEATTDVDQRGGTICIDTVTQLWEMIRVADTEAIKQVRKSQGKELFPYDYGDANERHRSLLYYLKDRCNVVLLAHSQEVWSSSGPTGEIVPHGNKMLRRIVQEEVHLQRSETRYVGKPPEVKFTGTVVFSRHNMGVAGIPMPNLDYRQLYMMLFGKEAPE
jgi:hypothetical protein